jgi:hypothetical protein
VLPKHGGVATMQPIQASRLKLSHGNRRWGNAARTMLSTVEQLPQLLCCLIVVCSQHSQNTVCFVRCRCGMASALQRHSILSG